MTQAATITSEMDHLDQLGAKAFYGYLFKGIRCAPAKNSWLPLLAM